MPTYGRTRNQDSSSPSSTCTYDYDYYTQWTNPSHATGQGSYGSFVASCVSRVTKDTVTKNYKKWRDQGAIINNDFFTSLDVTTRLPWAFHYHLIYTAYGYTGNYSLLSGALGWEAARDYLGVPSQRISGVKPEISTDVSSLAIAEAWARLSNSEWLAPVAILESRETWNMIVHAIRRAIPYLKGIRKLKVGSKRLNARRIQNLWLTYRYGIRPIVYDIQQALSALNTLGKPLRHSVRSHKLADSSASHEDDRSAGSLLAGTRVTTNTEVVRSLHATAGVLFDTSIVKSDIRRAFGLDVDDVLPTIWELVPYSFVIDWFINVADILATWSPHSEVRVLAAWGKLIERTEWHEKPNLYKDPDYSPYGEFSFNVYSVGGDVVRKYDEVLREANPARPLIPSVEIRLDVAKALDLLALLYQLKR